MRDPKLARRMSQAPPRMSIVFNTPITLNLDTGLGELGDSLVAMEGDAATDGTKAQRLREFCSDNIKSISTLILMAGMVFCIVMIVLVHKWNFEKTHGADWNDPKYKLIPSTTSSPLYSYFIHEKLDQDDWEIE